MLSNSQSPKCIVVVELLTLRKFSFSFACRTRNSWTMTIWWNSMDTSSRRWPWIAFDETIFFAIAPWNSRIFTVYFIIIMAPIFTFISSAISVVISSCLAGKTRHLLSWNRAIWSFLWLWNAVVWRLISVLRHLCFLNQSVLCHQPTNYYLGQ